MIDMLVEEGFRPVPSSYFGWYRPTDGSVIVDAKPGNFIKTSEGLIPIVHGIPPIPIQTASIKARLGKHLKIQLDEDRILVLEYT